MALRPTAALALVAACALAAIVPRPAAAQHITVDGRFSQPQTLVGPNYSIAANLGKQVGGNLFHSFGQFSLATPEKATFTSTGSTGPIGNVISRVTGGNGSKIDGTIQSKIAGANLYLINPNGILFGPNATVNVSGSFHASTADYVKMSDGAKFQATNPDGSTLSAAPPAAFGFLTATPRPIGVAGSTLGPVPGTLGLVAGPISIVGGTLTAPGGTIHVASAAGTGEVPVDPRNTAALTVKSFGPVDIKSGSTLDVSDPKNLGSGGSVFIRSGALTIDASNINADNYGSGPGGSVVVSAGSLGLANGGQISGRTFASGDAGSILLTVANQLTIDSSAGIFSQARPGSTGNAGPVTITAGSLSILNNGAISGSGFASGNAGSIKVIAFDQLMIDSSGGIFSQANSASGGAAGTIMVNAGSLSIRNNGSISTDNFGPGSGGSISVAAGTLTIVSSGEISSSTFGPGNAGGVAARVAGGLIIDGTGADPNFATGIFARANAGSIGNAGSVALTTGSLSIVNGGSTSSSTFGPGNGGSASIDVTSSQPEAATILSNGSVSASTLGIGNAGSVSVLVAGGLIIDGTGADPNFVTGIASRANAGSTGNAGSVTLAAGSLSIVNGGLIASDTSGPGDAGGVFVKVTDQLTVAGSSASGFTGISSDTNQQGPGKAGNAGDVMVSAGILTIVSNGEISSSTLGIGNAGSVSVRVAGGLIIDGTGADPNFVTGIASRANAGSTGNAGSVTLTAGSLSIVNGGSIASDTFGPGDAGGVFVKVTDQLTVAGSSASGFTGISSDTNQKGPGKAGNAGEVMVSAGTLTIVSNGELSSSTFGPGNAGSVAARVAGGLVIDGTGADPNFVTGIASRANAGSTGNAGSVTLTAGSLSIVNGGSIASDTSGRGDAGSVSVTAGTLSIAGNGAISSETSAGGDAGSVSIDVTSGQPGALTILTNGSVSASTLGIGNAGSVSVRVAGGLIIDGTGADPNFVTGIASRANAGSTGNAGSVTLAAGSLSIVNGGLIASDTSGPGDAGGVFVKVTDQLTVAGSSASGFTGISSDTNQQGPGKAGNAGDVMVSAGTLTIVSNGEISSSTLGIGNAGSVSVRVAGGLIIDGTGADPNFVTGIASRANAGSTGNAGSVTLAAGSLSIVNGGSIASDTFGPGDAGGVFVKVTDQLTVAGSSASGFTGISSDTNQQGPGKAGNAGDVMVSAGTLTIVSNGEISSSTLGIGNARSVSVRVAGGLIIDGAGADPNFVTGIFSRANAGSIGNAGSVTLSGGSLSIVNGGSTSSDTFGPGDAGSVFVTAGTLSVAGNGAISSKTSGGGDAGSVSIDVTSSRPGALTILTNGSVNAATLGIGNAGSVSVRVAGGLVIDGAGANPDFITGISSQTNPGSMGNAGDVTVRAGSLSIVSGGAISSSALGAFNNQPASTGKAGTVTVDVAGPLSVDGSGSAIATSTGPGTRGNAGSVTVTAGQITLASGGEITSTTAGTGAGGAVGVTTPGALVLDGAGDHNTQIAASATGPQSGSGGSVTVSAGSLTVEGGAQIASSTAGPGKGGDVNVTVASDIVLPDAGPQITARSTGSGDAGSITVSAVRLLMNNGAAISTEAETSTASGGNITLHVRDLLFLVSREITTSVKGETGNGGNITIEPPQLVILNHSSIIAEAIKGHGGNITITAGEFILSSDSIISATSQLGISGTVEINGPRVDVNGALVVLSTQLRSRTEVLREACAARADQPISSLVEAGRGGLPQDPEATLPALYIAGRDINPTAAAVAHAGELSGDVSRTTVHLRMRCG